MEKFEVGGKIAFFRLGQNILFLEKHNFLKKICNSNLFAAG